MNDNIFDSWEIDGVFNLEGGDQNDDFNSFNLETSGESDGGISIKRTPTNGPYLPKSTFAYSESECVIGKSGKEIEVTYAMPKTPTIDYELDMWNKLNEFEELSWSKSQLGLKTGFQKIDEAFDGGLKPGFIVVAADSNVGKTALLSQMAWNIADLNDGAYVMDFSLDDPLPDKLSRVIGCSGKVLINSVKNPNGYLEYPMMLARRAQTLNKLRERVDRYQAYDATFSTNIEDIEAEVQRLMIRLETEGEGRQVVVFIDNLHDLTIKHNSPATQKDKYDIIAQWAADLAIRYNIPVVCTAELKKINGNRRPELDDIRETGKIKYEAKAILLVYNEVHYKGEASEVYFRRQENPLKQPVLEFHFAKNKISSFKGRLFYEFYPELSRLEEPDGESIRHYAGLVYS